MEPFQLLCPGCAARLKVRNRSALGQRLACPKCREMILVAAPEGHNVGESTVESAGGFDDMDLDALLENRPARPPRSSKIDTVAPASINRPTPTNQPATRTAVAPPQTVQPGEDWTNPATKKKRKVILIAMGSLIGVLLLALIGFFVFSQANTDTRVADGDDPSKVEPTSDDADSPTSPPAEPETIVEPETADPPKDPADTNEMDTESDSPIVDDPLASVVPDEPPAILGLDLPDTPEPEPETPTVDPAIKKPDNRNDAAILRSVLAESETSMLKLQNMASRARENFSIGTPKYFFEKVDSPIDFTDRKDQELLGVSYTKQSLQTVMHELASISGLRLTINAPEIAAAGQNINPDVTLTIENESTGAVIRQIAKSVGLAATETDKGFVISRKRSDSLAQQSISIAAIIENEQDGQALAKQIQELVWPGSWSDGATNPPANDQAQQGRCRFANGNLEVEHFSAAIDELQRLVAGLKAAQRSDQQGSELLQPVQWIDRAEFDRPFNPQNSVRVSVGDFFRALNRDYQIQIMADWDALGETGWTSDALAAGWIEEPTLGDVVRETARAMGAGVYVVDERTVWLTTPSAANDIFLLKLYPLAKIANGRLTESSLRQIMLEALGDQTVQAGVTLSFLDRQKLMVVRAPQTLHRQIEAVLKDLK